MVRVYIHSCIVLFTLFVIEILFGMAPFASKTFEELEGKVLDETPIQVSIYLVLKCNINMYFRSHLIQMCLLTAKTFYKDYWREIKIKECHLRNFLSIPSLIYSTYLDLHR